LLLYFEVSSSDTASVYTTKELKDQFIFSCKILPWQNLGTQVKIHSLSRLAL